MERPPRKARLFLCGVSGPGVDAVGLSGQRAPPEHRLQDARACNAQRVSSRTRHMDTDEGCEREDRRNDEPATDDGARHPERPQESPGQRDRHICGRHQGRKKGLFNRIYG